MGGNEVLLPCETNPQWLFKGGGTVFSGLASKFGSKMWREPHGTGKPISDSPLQVSVGSSAKEQKKRMNLVMWLLKWSKPGCDMTTAPLFLKLFSILFSDWCGHMFKEACRWQTCIHRTVRFKHLCVFQMSNLWADHFKGEEKPQRLLETLLWCVAVQQLISDLLKICCVYAKQVSLCCHWTS